jgi:hypothetical protein
MVVLLDLFYNLDFRNTLGCSRPEKKERLTSGHFTKAFCVKSNIEGRISGAKENFRKRLSYALDLETHNTTQKIPNYNHTK